MCVCGGAESNVLPLASSLSLSSLLYQFHVPFVSTFSPLLYIAHDQENESDDLERLQQELDWRNQKSPVPRGSRAVKFHSAQGDEDPLGMRWPALTTAAVSSESISSFEGDVMLIWVVPDHVLRGFYPIPSDDLS